MSLAATTRVSVILPVHNASGYLDRTKRQLVGLDRSVTYEFVIIDDHSSDDSFEIVKSWTTQLPGDVFVLRADDRGVAQARNQALRACTGRYVWLTDADDEWAPTIVSELSHAAERAGAQMAVCNATKQTPGGKKVGQIDDATRSDLGDGHEAFLRLLNGNLQGHLWNKLFLRSALPVDPFPAIRAHSDLGCMLRLLPRLTTIAYLPRDLYIYQQNAGSILNSREYHFDDLIACLEIAREEAAMPVAIVRRALFTFEYRNIILPRLNELARRQDSLLASVTHEVAEQTRSMIRWGDLPSLILSTTSLRLIAQVIVAKVSWRLYLVMYSKLRRGKSGR